MWKPIAIVFLAAVNLSAAARIPAPADWRKESFEFPLKFAPSIPYEGEEHVRFAPYWSEFDTERGFTYVFLWDIKKRTLAPAELERALNVYFDGLMEQVTRGRKLSDPGTISSVALHPLAAPEGWSEALGGRLFTWNAFSKGEPLTLHLEIAHRACGGGRTQILFAFSQAARNRPAWDEMRAIRKSTRCMMPP